LPLERHELRHRDGRRLFVYGELRGTLEAEPAADRIGEQGPSAEPPGDAGLHKRLDRLSGAWIAISPARNVRPHVPRSAAQEEIVEPDADTQAGPPCPLCPGGPEIPFSYEAAVFENRFPSLVADPPPVPDDPRISPSQGRCEVVLYTERHRGSLATLTPLELARLITIWRDRSAELWADEHHRFVMVFENRGDAVGATISHPHGQIYAFDHVPPFIATRVDALRRHRVEAGGCLSCEVIDEDLRAPERIVLASDAFVVAVPFAARWPYEVHVRARRHGLGRLPDLGAAEAIGLSHALRQVVLRYDGLFGFELPYMMVVQEAPMDAPDWHLSFEFLPPHRTAVLTKIRASVETATGLFINDVLPESSASRLAALRFASAEVEEVHEMEVPDVVPIEAGRG
jgi:UDPglucose--hexose-1-phosphate uridylyltransferase